MKWAHSCVDKFDKNTKHSLILTKSKEVCNLWEIDTCNKHRSVYAQNNSFMDAQFSPDGTMLVTLFRDSSLYFWSMTTFDSMFKITDTESQANLTTFSMSSNMKYIISGGDCPFVYVHDIERIEAGEVGRTCLKLPEGYHSITKMHVLRDNRHFAFLSNGKLFLCKLEGIEDSESVEIAMSIDLPNQAIIDFDIDLNCFYAAIVGSVGDVYLYDLEKAIESEASVRV